MQTQRPNCWPYHLFCIIQLVDLTMASTAAKTIRSAKRLGPMGWNFRKKRIAKGIVSVTVITIVSCHDMWLLLSNNSFTFRILTTVTSKDINGPQNGNFLHGKWKVSAEAPNRRRLKLNNLQDIPILRPPSNYWSDVCAVSAQHLNWVMIS